MSLYAPFWNLFRTWALLGSLLWATSTAWAALPFTLTAETARENGNPIFRVHFDFPPRHIIYADISAEDAITRKNLPLLNAPTPLVKYDRLLEENVRYFDAPFTATFHLPELPLDATSWDVAVSWQGCDDTTCFFPQATPFSLAPTWENSTAHTPESNVSSAHTNDSTPSSWLNTLAHRIPRNTGGYLPPLRFLSFLNGEESSEESETSFRSFQQNPAEFFAHRGLGWTVLLILVGGLLLNLTPCVLPMIPVNLAIIGAGSKATSRRSGFSLGLTYAAGIAVSYGCCGLIVLFTGGVMGAWQASPTFNVVMAVFLTALALAMLDVWQLDLTRWSGALSQSPTRFHLAKYTLAFSLGLLSAVLAGACVAPVLLAVLGLSSNLFAQGQSLALIFPFLLGLGMALPWPLAGAGFAILPKPGAWMPKVKKVMGICILLFAASFLWTGFQLFRERQGTEMGTQDSLFYHIDLQTTTAEEWDRLIEQAVASEKTILLDFGAIWCKNCRAMERTTLQDPRVRAALETMFAIRIQADNPRLPLAAHICAELGIQGFPAYVLYSP